ncbi:MAG: Nif3-like dinuclear metal center hexameric protein [Bacteroidetes bacterium]|nr:MAG: Nif3-like dinuclear metal center hexameric protein [Bacteroidota bacterium]
MKIKDIINVLESFANRQLQEDYDNSGLLIGNSDWDCTGVLCTLDCTEKVIEEAIEKKCNLVVSHHPIIFKGIKRFSDFNYVQRCVIKSIKHDIAIYAIHTNLDNVLSGVNGVIAGKLGLSQIEVLAPKDHSLMKLYTFVPTEHASNVRRAMFEAGGGFIGAYSECSFNAEGVGTFKAGETTNPYVGEKGVQHQEKEVKIEVVFPAWCKDKLVKAMLEAHPYEEPAYDLLRLENVHSGFGSGLIGHLKEAKSEKDFLALVKDKFRLAAIRHTALRGKDIKKVAVCGGAGSFLIINALKAGADVFISSDIKYHEFFEADGKLVLLDIGHYESEQFTVDLLIDILREKFHTFAVLKSVVQTNPVQYYF